MEAQGHTNFSPSANKESRWAQLLKSNGNVEQTSHGSSEVKYPLGMIFKWWTIITLATDVGILVFACFACLPIWTLFESVLGRVVTDMLVFASILTRAGGIGLLVFASNAYLLGRILYHRCSKPEQLEEQVAVRAVGLDMSIKVWTVLIILIDVAAIVFPILTLLYRRPDVSYAQMHEEVYPHAGSASGLTAEDQLLYFCVFLWTIIFISNTLLLIRNLFHKCNGRKLHFAQAL